MKFVVILFVAQLSCLISGSPYDELFYRPNRRNRQLFVTMPSTTSRQVKSTSFTGTPDGSTSRNYASSTQSNSQTSQIHYIPLSYDESQKPSTKAASHTSSLSPKSTTPQSSEENQTQASTLSEPSRNANDSQRRTSGSLKRNKPQNDGSEELDSSNRRRLRRTTTTQKAPTSQTSISTFDSTYSIATTSASIFSPVPQLNSSEEEDNEIDHKPRSALIGVPSRDTQVSN